ncbi:Tetratricopeptide TPR_2 repeat-containing protein [Gemmatirosa kalamazoonensis]|uniref:Tetratricopeptide TPR_2 repeat-containing protein n=1 Tax=Gemmatirosa kalamazoonensis TaxID=861299 RepID=W0RKK4_9BACT|nr:tetratricopeptide repeat protein [Gemmatirosa kalamazoonensis]AHG91619.1 Tetratricopeptide TPR_2 repeat-containing protein [Gemmatirosa kalamazoonensis]
MRARAVDAYDRLRARLAREYELRPDASITALAEDLARRASAPETLTPETLTPETPAPEMSTPSEPRAARSQVRPAAPRASRSRVRAAGVLAAVGLVALGLAARRAPRTPPSTTTTPVVAVVPIDVAAADTALQWLSAGLPQLIVARLSRADGMEVVTPAQVRAVLRRGELGSAPLTAKQLRAVGRAVGASFVVSGTVERGATGMVLGLAVHDAATGRLVRADVVADSGVIALADRATVRLLDVVGVRPTGPRLADLETSSVEAYHHFVRFNEIVYERADEASAELDAAIALDSGFTSAVLARLARAYADNDGAVIDALTAVLHRRAGRIPERDRVEWQARQAMLAGDVAGSEAASRLLVARYPRDPRGYEMLATVLDNAGRWDARARALESLLALDSLGIEAGRGPCTSCTAYSSLTEVRLALGDWDGAERAARRWTVVAPEMHAAWTNLALVHAYRGRHDLALEAMRRAISLAPDEPGVRMAWGWVLVMARRLDDADTAIASWRASGVRALQVQAEDLASVVLRERGQFRASTEAIARAEATYPELAYLELVRANGLARAGDCAAAVRAYERVHGAGAAEPPPGGPSRAFAWHHALLADAVADTPCARDGWLRALADSIERIGARSYFGRDWVLHHHVRGLVAMRAGDWPEAERQLRRARWRVADGWTSTSIALARTQLALGRPLDAVATLRDAYAIRPDAVGRYVPRTEIDHYMALAFRRAGMADSAALYAAYVRRAWAHADPALRTLSLER